MSDKNREGLKRISVFASILVYIAFVAYSEFHFWNLVSSFVPLDFQVLGVVAVAASAISALALPVALHFWCREGVQRIVAWGFTIVHLLIVFANLVLDSATISGASVSDEFINIYAVYVLPGTVAFYALGWLLVWASDTDVQRAEQARETREAEEDGRWKLRKIVAEEKTRALESAFQSDHAKRKIDRYAGRVAPRILAEELGLSPEELGVEEGEVWDFWNGHKKDTPQTSQSVPTTPVNGANGHTGQMSFDAPAAPQGQRQADLPPAGNGRAPGNGRPKVSSRPVAPAPSSWDDDDGPSATITFTGTTSSPAQWMNDEEFRQYWNDGMTPLERAQEQLRQVELEEQAEAGRKWEAEQRQQREQKRREDWQQRLAAYEQQKAANRPASPAPELPPTGSSGRVPGNGKVEPGK